MVKEGYSREVIPAASFNENTETPVRKEVYASKETVITAALIPLAASIPLIYKKVTESYSTTTIPVTANVTAPVVAPPPLIPPAPTQEALNSVANAFPTGQPEVLAQPVGFATDKSLELLANVLDPIIQLMVVISLPIASVIMVGGLFFFLIGNTEKAWTTIFNAGLGYVLIQLSPLFLNILKNIGEAV